MMIRLVPRWGPGVALVAIYALILQTVLHSLAPLAKAAPNLHNISVVVCPPSDHSPAQDEAPDAPTDRSDAACCILCVVPGLDAANTDIRFAATDYQSSSLSPLTVWIGADPSGAAELLPINPRAPPRLT